MYTLLYGAKKNVGDFLILDRAIKLFNYFLPDEELNLVKRWLPIDDQLERINKSKAVILCGGPAYQVDFYPGIYPFSKDLNDIKVPIIPFGLGWFSEYADQTPTNFNFSNYSKLMIEKVHENCRVSSTRDVYTSKVLEEMNIHNFLMTGCPAWYDLEYMDEKFQSISEVKNIVVTTAQNPTFHEQNIEIIRETARIFPDSKKYLTFHRGILADSETHQLESNNLLKLVKVGEDLGYEIKDVSYDVEKIDFYKKCDLHIGYRLHAHIYFLSIRKPTFLIHEDSRGKGFSETLQLKTDFHVNDENMVVKFMNGIETEANIQFKSFLGLEKKFEAFFINMKQFFNSLPR